MKSGNLNFLEPSGPLQACNGTALPLPLSIYQTKRRHITEDSNTLFLKELQGLMMSTIRKPRERFELRQVVADPQHCLYDGNKTGNVQYV